MASLYYSKFEQASRALYREVQVEFFQEKLREEILEKILLTKWLLGVVQLGQAYRDLARLPAPITDISQFYEADGKTLSVMTEVVPRNPDLSQSDPALNFVERFEKFSGPSSNVQVISRLERKRQRLHSEVKGDPLLNLYGGSEPIDAESLALINPRKIPATVGIITGLSDDMSDNGRQMVNWITRMRRTLLKLSKALKALLDAQTSIKQLADRQALFLESFRSVSETKKQEWKQVRNVEFIQTRLRPAGWAVLLKYVTQLEQIHLSAISSEGVEVLARNCPQLREFQISGVTQNISEESLTSLVERCTKLESIEFNARDSLVDSGDSKRVEQKHRSGAWLVAWARRKKSADSAGLTHIILKPQETRVSLQKPDFLYEISDDLSSENLSLLADQIKEQKLTLRTFVWHTGPKSWKKPAKDFEHHKAIARLLEECMETERLDIQTFPTDSAITAISANCRNLSEMTWNVRELSPTGAAQLRNYISTRVEPAAIKSLFLVHTFEFNAPMWTSLLNALPASLQRLRLRDIGISSWTADTAAVQQDAKYDFIKVICERCPDLRDLDLHFEHTGVVYKSGDHSVPILNAGAGTKWPPLSSLSINSTHLGFDDVVVFLNQLQTTQKSVNDNLAFLSLSTIHSDQKDTSSLTPIFTSAGSFPKLFYAQLTGVSMPMSQIQSISSLRPDPQFQLIVEETASKSVAIEDSEETIAAFLAAPTAEPTPRPEAQTESDFMPIESEKSAGARITGSFMSKSPYAEGTDERFVDDVEEGRIFAPHFDKWSTSNAWWREKKVLLVRAFQKRKKMLSPLERRIFADHDKNRSVPIVHAIVKFGAGVDDVPNIRYIIHLRQWLWFISKKLGDVIDDSL